MELCHFYHQHMDARVRPRIKFREPPMREPWKQMEPTTFREATRFLPCDWLPLVAMLDLPTDDNGFIRTSRRCKATPPFAMFILLRRWSVPDRWVDIEALLRLRKGRLNAIYMTTLGLLVERFRVLVTKVDILRIYPQMALFADSVVGIGGLLEDVVCFVDGKAWGTCKPKGDFIGDEAIAMQQIFYNGYYRVHGLKMQNIMFPDGIRLVHVESIQVHDSQLLQSSEFEVQLSTMFIDGDVNRPAQVYGDPAYSESRHVARKHKGAARTPEQLKKDVSMMAARAAVEDGFLVHSQLWSLMNLKNKNMILKTPLMDQMIGQTFMCNLHTCFYGSMVNSLFDIAAPSPEEYLNSHKQGFLVS